MYLLNIDLVLCHWQSKSFSKKNNWRTSVLFVGPLIPCLKLLVTSALDIEAGLDPLV